jgi:hypothetical protein
MRSDITNLCARLYESTIRSIDPSLRRSEMMTSKRYDEAEQDALFQIEGQDEDG